MSQSKLLYVEPNPLDTRPNIEDLCINVELKTYERNRSSLKTTNGITTADSSAGKVGGITFVTPYSDKPIEEDRSLTTNYTNIHTSFTKDSKGLETQSLGITSIDITFDTSYTPQITINFTDVRGSSLFEAMSYYQDNNGKKPPYSCFYELPYPLFELTIKGFYGKPVVYQLHLLDFKSNFNSSTGNFDFTCKFVGYTYAFLSDMLLGFMSAIVYTPAGQKKFEDLSKNKYKIESYTGDVVNLPTLVEFERLCQQVNKALDDSKSDDEAQSKVDNTADKITTIDEIKSLISVYFGNIGGSGLYSTFVNGSNIKMLYSWYEPVTGTTGNYNYVKQPKNFIEFNKERKKTSLTQKAEDAKTRIFQKIKIDSKLESLSSNIGDVLGGKKVTLITNDVITDNTFSIDGFKYTIPNTHPINSVYLMDSTELISTLDELKFEYEREQEKLKDGYGVVIDEIIKRNFNFEPSIKNIFKIFLAHAETLIGTLVDLSEKIETTGREIPPNIEKEINLQDINHSTNTENKLYVFPEYAEFDQRNGGYKSKWIGSNSNFKDLDEVKYVKNLITAMIQTNKKKDENLIEFENGMNNQTQWIPIHPLDLPQFRNDVHPYQEISKLNISEIELFRYIVQRFFLASSPINRTSDEYNSTKLICKKEISNLTDKFGKDIKKLKLLYNNIDNFLKTEINRKEYNTYPYAKDNYDYLILNGKKSNHLAIPTNRYIRLDFDSKNKKPLEYKNQINDYFITQDNMFGDNNLIIIDSSDLTDYSNLLPSENYKTIIGDTVSSTLGIIKTSAIDVINSAGQEVSPRQAILELNATETTDINNKIEKICSGNISEKPTKIAKEYLNPITSKTFFSTGLRYSKSEIVEEENFNENYTIFDGLESRTHDLFFLDTDYLSIKNQYKRALLLLVSTRQYKIDLGDLINEDFFKNGTLLELPKLLVYLIGGMCYSDREKKTNNNFSDIIDFDTSSRINDSVRGVFIKEFINWVNGETKEENDSFNIMEKALSGGILNNYYVSESNPDNKNTIVIKNETIQSIKTEIINGSAYSGNFGVVNNPIEKKYVYYFKQPISDLYVSYLKSTKILLLNNIYEGSEITQPNQLIIKEFRTDKIDKFFSFFKTELETYITNAEKNKTREDETLSDNYEDLNSDDFRLSVYTSLKSINDKWIGNRDDMTREWYGVGNSNFTKDLIDRFLFIDRAYNEIGDNLLVKPDKILDVLSNNPNQSLMDILSRILAQNKMIFTALPAFFNYRKPEELVDAFRVYSYNEAPQFTLYGSSFVCMYVGDTSKHLDLGSDTDFKNDGFDIEVINGEAVCGAPDFTSKQIDENTRFIPAFGVNYGVQNQKMFTNLELNQEQFSESQESLYNTDDIAKQGAKRKNYIGQNLFNVWTTRSYEASIEMLGNAQIQPMMYFQLNYVPMYHGVYLIKSVSHSIKPNFMTTKFKGQRMRRWATPLIGESVIYTDFYVAENGNKINVPITSSEKNKTVLSQTEQLQAETFLKNLTNSNAQVIKLYGDLYTKNKSATDMSWEKFYERLQKMANNVKTKPIYLAHTIFVESSFDWTAVYNVGKTDPKTKKLKTSYTLSELSNTTAASGYNQITASTMKDMFSSASGKKTFRELGKTSLLNKVTNYFSKQKENGMSTKEINIRFFREEINQNEALDLTEIYFVWRKRGSLKEITSPSTLYIVNFQPSKFKEVNDSGNDVIIATKGEKEYDWNKNVSGGYDIITPNTMLLSWSKRRDLKPILKYSS